MYGGQTIRVGDIGMYRASSAVLPAAKAVFSVPFVYQDARALRSQGHSLFNGPANSSPRHRWASEQMTLRWDGQTTRLFGVLNEIQGLLWHDLPDLRGRITGERAWAFHFNDFIDNEMGIVCGRQKLGEPTIWIPILP